MMMTVKICRFVLNETLEKKNLKTVEVDEMIVMVTEFLIVKMPVQALHDHDDVHRFQVANDYEILYDESNDHKF
jgi:hypothetical protein